MDLTMHLQKTVEKLEDGEKLLLLEIAKRFLADDDILSDEDLHYIEIGEKELETGTHGNWANIRRD